MLIANVPAATPRPAVSVEQLRSNDLSAPLQPLDRLDVVPDGRLTTLDGAAYDVLADAASAAAELLPASGPPVPPAAPASPGDRTATAERIPISADGRLDVAGLSRDQLIELSEKLHWTGQQARYGAALLAPDAPLPSTTVHNIVPTPGLAGPVTPRGLIDAIKQVDTAALRAAGVRPVAAFDVDGTTIKGDIFMPFTELMAEQRRFTPGANVVFREVLGKLDVDPEKVASNDANANARLLLGKVDPSVRKDTPTQLSVASAFFAVADALGGQRLDDLQGVARDLMEHGVGRTPPYKQRINDDSARSGDSVVDVVGALEQQGITPYVVTYGFDWLARVAAQYVGFDPEHLIGTHSEVRDGVLTGVHNGREIPTKDVLVRKATGTPPLFVFGDSGSDLPMLDVAVARGVVVNPTASMLEKMDERNGQLGEVRYSGTVHDAPEVPPAAARS